MLLAFSVSLVFFNRGEIFRSVPLVYPVLLYFLARGLWVGSGRQKGSPSRSLWPTWLLAAAAIFLLGFRIGLNVETPRGVIDVGLAGVAGASRILDGQAPYGNMPQRDALEECFRATFEATRREKDGSADQNAHEHGQADPHPDDSGLASIAGFRQISQDNSNNQCRLEAFPEYDQKRARHASSPLKIWSPPRLSEFLTSVNNNCLAGAWPLRI